MDTKRSRTEVDLGILSAEESALAAMVALDDQAAAVWDHGDAPAGHAMPSPALLRQWSRESDNEFCWGLDVVADELERLRRAAGEA